ncbi:MAG: hypothetical protein ACI9OJ_000524 [Myxococcota bacterium]|jgi:uncharacterized protein (DUF2236 family)
MTLWTQRYSGGLAAIIDGTLHARRALYGQSALENSTWDERRREEQLYEEFCMFGETFALPRQYVPQTVSDFERYFHNQLDIIAVGPNGLMLSQFLQDQVPRPKLPWKIWVTGTLPPNIRTQFQLRWPRPWQAAFGMMLKLLRNTVPRVPQTARRLPSYRGAMRRMSGEPLKLTDRVFHMVAQLIDRAAAEKK